MLDPIPPERSDVAPEFLSVNIEHDLLSPRIVIMQVLRQHEGLRSVGFEFRASSGMRLQSSNYPEITTTTLYIRGVNRSLDNRIVSREFDSREEAAEFIQRVKEMVAEVNAKSTPSLRYNYHLEQYEGPCVAAVVLDINNVILLLDSVGPALDAFNGKLLSNGRVIRKGVTLGATKGGFVLSSSVPGVWYNAYPDSSGATNMYDMLVETLFLFSLQSGQCLVNTYSYELDEMKCTIIGNFKQGKQNAD